MRFQHVFNGLLPGNVRERREVKKLSVVGRELQQKRPVSVPTVVANLIQMVDSFRRRALLLRKLQLLSIT